MQPQDDNVSKSATAPAPGPRTPAQVRVQQEIQQAHEQRIPLLKRWQQLTGRYPLTYFANFTNPKSLMSDTDVDLIEDLLQAMPSRPKLDLIIDSPGGFPLSAERVVKTCCRYSADFRVVVPKRAKSAATMVAMGASSILMGPAAELGPIDPQITYTDRLGQQRQAAVYSLVKAVDDTIAKIQAVPQGTRIEGLLAMLPPFDAATIVEMRRYQDLAASLAVQFCSVLPAFNGKSADDIKAAIKIFLDPEETFSHGRPIDAARAKATGLPVVEIEVDSEEWQVLWELYTRSKANAMRGAKAMETADLSFMWE